MQRIPREQARKYAFDWRDEPLLRVRPGESFEIETWDASTGYFKTPADKAIPGRRPGFDRSPPHANPIGGPVYLQGAQRGDTLVVTIEDIVVADYSWIAIGPKRGPLGESTRWPELSGDYTTKIFRHTPGPSGTMRDGTVHFSERLSWPITPFIGTLGVAPDREVTTSLDGQGEWGGNLDIRDVCPGNRILLPIFHEGALFYLGDVHASQGDTEFTGTAAETQATVRVRLDLLKGQRVPWLRIDKPESMVSVYAYRPLEVAVETATINLIDWLVRDFGFTPTDAYCLVSTCPDFRIHVYQMCKLGEAVVCGRCRNSSKILELGRFTDYCGQQPLLIIPSSITMKWSSHVPFLERERPSLQAAVPVLHQPQGRRFLRHHRREIARVGARPWQRPHPENGGRRDGRAKADRGCSGQKEPAFSPNRIHVADNLLRCAASSRCAS